MPADPLKTGTWVLPFSTAKTMMSDLTLVWKKIEIEFNFSKDYI